MVLSGLFSTRTMPTLSETVYVLHEHTFYFGGKAAESLMHPRLVTEVVTRDVSLLLLLYLSFLSWLLDLLFLHCAVP